jgi:hypothetical protein
MAFLGVQAEAKEAGAVEEGKKGPHGTEIPAPETGHEDHPHQGAGQGAHVEEKRGAGLNQSEPEVREGSGDGRGGAQLAKPGIRKPPGRHPRPHQDQHLQGGKEPDEFSFAESQKVVERTERTKPAAPPAAQGQTVKGHRAEEIKGKGPGNNQVLHEAYGTNGDG